MKKIFYFIVLLLLLIPINVYGKEINLYLFYQETCPHCEEEIKFFNEYQEENKDIRLIKYEISQNKDNRELFKEAKKVLKKNVSGVPYLIIGSSVIVGYDESYTKDNIIDKIEYYRNNTYEDIFGNYLKGINSEVEETNETHITLPLFGKVNIKQISIPLIAIVLGFIDGFNPCALWILIFLITMLFGMKNRKRMWILGITFLLTSGLIYLLFMLSWLNIASIINSVNIIKILIGVFACLFGSYNIYNSLSKKEVGCEVTTDKRRKNIIDKIKSITSESKFILSFLGIIILAISVNFIELMCSLGLPIMFTQILSLNNLNVLEYGINMFIYILFYLIDDIIIFVLAMKTLEIKAISNKYGKYSHLIGGIIMFLLGLLMIFKPQWLMFNI